MGLRSYFTPGKAKEGKNDPVKSRHGPVESTSGAEKPVQGQHDPTLASAPAEASHSDVTAQVPSGSNSVPNSRPGSIFASGEARSTQNSALYDIKCDVMVNYLHQQQLERMWTIPSAPDEGVVLKKSRGQYTACPQEISPHLSAFAQAVEGLNVKVAMTINTRVIRLFLQNNQQYSVPLSNGLSLQVLPDLSLLPRCQKHQCAAFIADRGLLVVWDDEPKNLLTRGQRIQEELMNKIWEEEGDDEVHEKVKPQTGVTEVVGAFEVDPEKGDADLKRPVMLWQCFHTALCILLTSAALGAGYRQLALEIMVDHNYIRLLFVLVLPAQVWLALFFFQALIGNLMEMFGPVKQVHYNTKFYSGKPPRRLQRNYNVDLPHVTIQMPVYKEGLATVIEPTIKSIKAAMSTYEMQGGSANILVHDDGMQLINERDRRARLDFYDEHNIGWTSRPAHKPKPSDGEQPFLRRGKFKKASNMNYGLWISNRIEAKLAAVQRDELWTQEHEAEAYKAALAEVLEEDNGRTWADGNVRVGDYILLIDCDTRVPTDCFLDAVSEMEQNMQVSIVQFKSGVMNVTDSFFEKGITFFTHLIYTAIRYAVANGDVAPFIGHNAFLRWAAIQEVAFECPHDKYEKFWSEDTVSEDFDMALRLQTAGYVVRFASYTGEGFKEGVSLTVYDELNRWEKYAYGCSELVFHPFKDWWRRGPLTPLFCRFIASGMPLPCKITVMAYIGTYYALASAWLLTLLNYFLTGWFNGFLDHYYIDSFKLFVSIITVFTGLGNIALAVLRYRIEEKALLPALLENFRWVPLLTVFLGGVSLHVSQAILSHMFSVDVSWGSTSKEAENTTFFVEAPRVLRKFKGTFAFCVGAAAMMGTLAWVVPYFWRIRLFISIWPLATIVFGHFFLPLALNPGLMLFTW